MRNWFEILIAMTWCSEFGLLLFLDSVEQYGSKWQLRLRRQRLQVLLTEFLNKVEIKIKKNAIFVIFAASAVDKFAIYKCKLPEVSPGLPGCQYSKSKTGQFYLFLFEE